MSLRTLDTHQEGRVLTIEFDNPPRHYMDARMSRELARVIERVERDRSIGAVVLTGHHPGFFVTHYDPAEIAAASARARSELTPRASRALLRIAAVARRSPPLARALSRTAVRGALGVLDADLPLARMNRMDKVFVAAINGMAMGTGFILASACDIRLAADGEYRVGLPEPSIGFVPATGVQRLTHMVGPGRAIELLLDARVLAPGEALELGLVHRVVPAEELRPAARELAHRVSRRRPPVVRELKHLVYDASTRRRRTALHLERAALLSGMSSPSTALALNAYIDVLGAPGDGAGHLAAWEKLSAGHLVDLVERP